MPNSHTCTHPYLHYYIYTPVVLSEKQFSVLYVKLNSTYWQSNLPFIFLADVKLTIWSILLGFCLFHYRRPTCNVSLFGICDSLCQYSREGETRLFLAIIQLIITESCLNSHGIIQILRIVKTVVFLKILGSNIQARLRIQKIMKVGTRFN